MSGSWVSPDGEKSMHPDFDHPAFPRHYDLLDDADGSRFGWRWYEDGALIERALRDLVVEPADPVIIETQVLDADDVAHQLAGGAGPLADGLLSRLLDEPARAYALIHPMDDSGLLAHLRYGLLSAVEFHWDATAAHLAERLDAQGGDRLVFQWLRSPSQQVVRDYAGPKLAGEDAVYIPARDATPSAILEAYHRAKEPWTTVGAITRAQVPATGSVSAADARAWAEHATLAVFGAWDGLGIVLVEFTS